jgi:hypothetical protein
LFTDLPPRRARASELLARIRTALKPKDRGARADEERAIPAVGPVSRSGGPVPGPAPLVFPPGRADRFTIGRTRDCDLCLTDLSVSRLHAELVRWQVPARLVRGEVLTIREHGFVLAARSAGTGNWRLIYPAGVCIVLTVMALNFISDALRDSLDVRLRRR